jgi:hypothetical protein
MVGESTMLGFEPAGGLRETAAWAMDKLGVGIDPEDVLAGGNQMNHAVDSGVQATAADGRTLVLTTLDAPVVCPITPDYPQGYPLPAGSPGLLPLQRGSVLGMGINLHNNLWNTNYPLYYPFYDHRYCKGPLDCSNANMRFRFELAFLAAPDGAKEAKG